MDLWNKAKEKTFKQPANGKNAEEYEKPKPKPEPVYTPEVQGIRKHRKDLEDVMKQ